MFDLTGQVAIITGSGSARGIGRAIAVAMAEQGSSVVIADINESGVNETIDIISSSGGEALGVKLDVTDQASVDSMIETVLKAYTKIDILVNNAGISQRVTVEEMTIEDMRRVFEINMFGLFRCSKAVLAPMKAQKYGRIINMSSAAGKRGGGFFGGAHYSASKAAVLGFSKNLAREVAQYGITVNSIAPGLIDTDIWATMPKDVADQIIAGIPVGRPGDTKEIAAAVCYLASKEASFITGEDIDINGGSHMD